jgi:hypothetical protein
MKRKFIKPITLAALLTSSAATLNAQTILYVNDDATGTNNGSSWTNAYTSLQSAIATARANAATTYEIWVAGGTYKPSHDPSGNANPTKLGDKTFYLANNASYYGGFAGTESNISERDLNNTVHASILNGDLNDDNIFNTGDAFHVVMSIGATNNNVFDGFTITGGYATEATPLTVSGKTVYRDAGAGMNNAESSPNIANCTFIKNKSMGNAGGILNNNNSNPSITFSTFKENTANYGGAMYNAQSSPQISYCTFTADTAIKWGGAIINNGGSSPTIDYCIFTGNSAEQGSSIYSQSASTLTVNGSSFHNNYATYEGAGIYTTNAAQPNISNSLFSGNEAANGPAIFINAVSGYSINNCGIFGNKATNAGGGIFLNTAQGSISNCTVSGNSAENIGGGLYYNNVAGGRITNTIVYGNTTPNTTDDNRKEIYKDGVSINPANALIINYSILKDYLSTANNDFNWGVGNSTEDPLFVNPQDPSTTPTMAGDYRLQYCSPAIDKGDSATNEVGYPIQAPDYDLFNNQRIINNRIDIGAYEKIGLTPDMESSAALTNSIYNDFALVPTCVDHDNWTWYTTILNPDSLVLGIKWDVADTVAQDAAQVYLKVSDNAIIAKNNDQALVAMNRYWQVNLGNHTLTQPVTLRFLHTAADTVAMRSEATALNLGNIYNVTWFQTTNTVYDTTQIAYNTINNGNYTILQPTFGVANNIPYVQFNNLTQLNGGSAVLAAGSDPLSIIETRKSADINIYPNPNTGNFTINFKDNNATASIAIIYDALGRKVWEQKLQLGINTIQSSLTSGVYYITVKGSQTLVREKLVIQ